MLLQERDLSLGIFHEQVGYLFSVQEGIKWWQWNSWHPEQFLTRNCVSDLACTGRGGVNILLFFRLLSLRIQVTTVICFSGKGSQCQRCLCFSLFEIENS